MRRELYSLKAGVGRGAGLAYLQGFVVQRVNWMQVAIERVTKKHLIRRTTNPTLCHHLRGQEKPVNAVFLGRCSCGKSLNPPKTFRAWECASG